MDRSTKPRLASYARLSTDRVTGQPVLLAPESAVNLNSTALAVLELCDGERTLQQIVEALSKRFDAPEDMLAADVEDLLQRIANGGCVVLDLGE